MRLGWTGTFKKKGSGAHLILRIFKKTCVAIKMFVFADVSAKIDFIVFIIFYIWHKNLYQYCVAHSRHTKTLRFRKDVNDKYSMCILCMVFKKISNFQLGFQLTEMTHIHVMNSFDVIMCTVKYAVCCALLTYNRYSRQIMTKWLFADNENGGFCLQLKGFRSNFSNINRLSGNPLYVTLWNIILMFFLAINCRMLILTKKLFYCCQLTV